MTRNRERRALRTALVTSGFGYAAQALSLVAVPMFLGTLGVDGYGLMVTVMAFMGYLCFADAGLSWGAMILIAQAHGRNGKSEIAHIVRHSVVLAMGSGLLVGLGLGALLLGSALGWSLPMFAGRSEASRLLSIAALQLALTLQFSIFYNLFQGLQEGYWAGVYQGAGRVIGTVGAMLAAWLTRSVEAVMLVQLAATVGSGTLAALHAVRRHPWAFVAGPWTDGAQYRAQARIGAKNFLLQIGRTLSGTAPTLCISAIAGTAAVPFYTVPFTLLTMFFAPINSWVASMQSAYGEASVSGAIDWVRTSFRESIERALIFGGLGLAMFLALGDPFLRLWTQGRLWLTPEMAASVAGITIVSTLVAAGQYLLTGLNRHKHAAVAELANGLLAIVLVAFCVRGWGPGSVGAAVVLAALATSGWVLRRELAAHLGRRCLPSAGFLGRIALALMAGTTAAWATSRGAEGGAAPAILFSLVLGALFGIGVFFAVAVALKLVAVPKAAAWVRLLKLRLAASSP